MTTRAELLEQCQAAGLKATAWKKERMAAELAKLTGGVHEPEQGEAAVEPASPKQETSKLSGWCMRAPLWSYQHGQCKAPCECECHAVDFVQPPVPEGAALSKFNPERSKEEQ